MSRAVLAAVATLAVLPGALAGQAPPLVPAKPSFEAASIKSPDPNGVGAIDLRFFPNRFVATTVTLFQLIQQAYSLEFREIEGGPDWVRAERFDVTATSGSDVSRDQMKLMLQSLLADRFQLQLERETKTGTVYRLTTRGVRGLNPPAKPEANPLVSTIRRDGNGFLSYQYAGRNAAISDLATTLAQHVRAPVVDETKIPGRYDFSISWSYEEPLGGLQPDPDVPTIFTALENDLGLKLVADRGPVSVHVIRRAAKPSAN